MKRLSFLIAAHNEEKIIGKTLENLYRLPYENYEVILGLDGCTDKTEEIVKSYCNKSKKFKYFFLNLRSGKPAVINELIKKATGDIVMINDADWIFTVNDSKTLRKFISIFDNEDVGGIAESFPAEGDLNKIQKGNIGFLMSAYSSHYWLEYQKKFLSTKRGDLFYVNNPLMFLTNVFRRELYRENSSLGDDFERTKHIVDAGYKVVLFDNPKMPRMIISYNKVSISDLFKQKIRTATARRQLKETDQMNTTIFNYYLPSVWYIFKNSWKKSLYVGFAVSLWILITTLGSFVSRFKKMNTKKGWTFRIKR